MGKENKTESKKENKKEDCIFCKIVSGEISSKKLYEDDNFLVVLDAFPQVEGHTLIISKKHFRNLLDMPSTLGNEMISIAKKVAFDIIKEGKAEGFNLVINNEECAGQAVFHTHIHILPRKKGDGFKIFYKEGKNLS
jgi:histidine triad (HIT) family protein